MTPRGFTWFIGATAGLLALPLVALLGSPVGLGTECFFLGRPRSVWWALKANVAAPAVKRLTWPADRDHSPTCRAGPALEWKRNPALGDGSNLRGDAGRKISHPSGTAARSRTGIFPKSENAKDFADLTRHAWRLSAAQTPQVAPRLIHKGQSSCRGHRGSRSFTYSRYLVRNQGRLSSAWSCYPLPDRRRFRCGPVPPPLPLQAVRRAHFTSGPTWLKSSRPVYFDFNSAINTPHCSRSPYRPRRRNRPRRFRRGVSSSVRLPRQETPPASAISARSCLGEFKPSALFVGAHAHPALLDHLPQRSEARRRRRTPVSASSPPRRAILAIL